ncbi:hypothetical protein [Thalassobaculum sp.]|uniref:hypothetical protein n=1 Tax=Thalassobaculum sp. TaxID=2022740 RepID=UPI0032EDE676
MSMPYGVLACPSCGYEATTKGLWGLFVYRSDQGAEVHIERHLGWCHSCHGVAAIEALPDAGRIQAEQVEAKSRWEALIPTTGLQRLRGLFSGSARGLRRQALDALRRADLLAAVVMPGRSPCCLDCGSTDVEVIVLPNPESRGQMQDQGLAFRHPGCPKPMRLRESGGTRFAMAPTKRVYDPQGRFIEHADPRSRLVR